MESNAPEAALTDMNDIRPAIQAVGKHDLGAGSSEEPAGVHIDDGVGCLGGDHAPQHWGIKLRRTCFIRVFIL